MIKPEDLLHFIETPDFTESWEDLGLDDEDLAALQMTIMGIGRRAPVIKGTSGMRKLRFAPPKWKVGKSGGLRVCFVNFGKHGVVLLVLVFAKNDRQDVSEAEKHLLRNLIEVYERELDRLNQPKE